MSMCLIEIDANRKNRMREKGRKTKIHKNRAGQTRRENDSKKHDVDISREFREVIAFRCDSCVAAMLLARTAYYYPKTSITRRWRVFGWTCQLQAPSRVH